RSVVTQPADPAASAQRADSSRQVMSMRSRARPSVRNRHDSSRLIVLSVTPTKKAARSFTNRKNSDGLAPASTRRSRSASQVALRHSHISELMASRTPRAFSRAFLAAAPLADAVRLATPFAGERVRVGLAELPGGQPPAYIVDHPPFYDRPGSPYAAPDGGDWPDNHRRFALLAWIAARLGAGADPAWRPHIVHAHDWHAGLAPAYLAAFGRPAASVFTVHNLAYQGFFGADVFAELALPGDFFSINGVEYYGGVSFLKAGLYYADRLSTVSPSYAAEIQTPAFGMRLEGLLRARAPDLRGILNGVDPRIWSPERDAILPLRYSRKDAARGKAAAKAALQRRCGLAEDAAAPLFGTVSRLTWQKGLDLLLAAAPALVAAGAQIALLGSGDPALER